MIKKHQNQKARIAILIAIIVTALAEALFRAIVMKEAALGTANAGEQVTVILFAAIILLFAVKGNDKISYISCGALIAYFVMDQLFELPGMIVNLFTNISEPDFAISIAIRILTMFGILVLSALLIEYVNDGSIYNRAFNICYWITIILHVAVIVMCILRFTFGPDSQLPNGMELTLIQQQGMLVVFNNVHRLLMVVLFTSFAYDSANRQLKRENLTK